MSIANGLALPNPLSNGTTADAVPVMADFNYLLGALNRALLDAGGGSGMNAQNTQIHNLSSGTSANDAVNLSQLGGYLPLAGGTLTGGLNGTTLSLSSTLSVTGAATLAAISGTSLVLSSGASITGNLTVNSGTINAGGNLSFTQNNLNVLFKDLSGGTPSILCDASGNFTFATSNASGAPTAFLFVGTHTNSPTINLVFPALLQSTLGVTGATTLAALTASGLITGSAGFSGTTLSLSSTLGVAGASTLAAVTASGLITGNAGFSGTSLALSTTLGVTGQSTLGNVTGTPNGTAVNGLGYLGAPQNLKTANYTLALSDMAESVDMNGSNLTLTIPANSSVAFPVGTIILGTNLNATNLTIAITTDTLTISGTTSTGSRTIGQNGEFRLKKVGTTSWMIAGTAMS